MKKKLLSLLSLALAIAILTSILASCNSSQGSGTDTDGTDTAIECAINQLISLYQEESETPRDYDVIGEIIVDGKRYNVSWTVNHESITVNESTAYGYFTIDIPDEVTERTTYTLTATVTAENGAYKELSFAKVIPYLAPAIPEADSTLTVTEAIELGLRLTSFTDGKYYVSGTVNEITSIYDGSMRIVDADGNIFYVNTTYNRDGSLRFDAMQTRPTVGDMITVYGVIGSIDGIPQMKNGNIILINGEDTMPEAPEQEPEYNVVPDAKSGTAYKLGFIQANAGGTVYYLAGGMSGLFLATTADVKQAINVYLEDTVDGYYLYTIANNENLYINIVENGIYVDAVYNAIPCTVYTFDKEHKTPITDINGTSYCLGTRNDATFTAMGACVAFVNVLYSHFYSANVVEIPDEPIVIPPDGTINNPYIIDSFPYDISHTGIHDVYYAFTADKDTAITVKYSDGATVSGLPENHVENAHNMTYTVMLKSGETVKLNVCGLVEGIEYTYQIASYEIKATVGGDGSMESPYLLPESAGYICNYTEKWSAIWYIFTAPRDGIITVASGLETAWIQVGLDVSSASSNSNNGTGDPIRCVATSGQKIFIGIADWEGNQISLPFTVEFEETEFQSTSFLAGNWAGIEHTTWGDEVSYTVVIKENGKGKGLYNAGYGKTYFEITDILFLNGEVILKTVTDDGYDGYKMDIFFSYTTENGEPKLSSDKALYWCHLVLTPYYGEVDEDLTSDDETHETELMPGNTELDAGSHILTYTATESGLISISVATVSDDVIIAYSVNGKGEEFLNLQSAISIGLAQGDVLTVTVLSEDAITVSATWETCDIESVLCNFNTIPSGTQYANESVTFENAVSVSTYNNGCYINTYLRIYDGENLNGYAVLSASKNITSLSFNAGYKNTELCIYGSVDGESWEIVKTVEISESYTDYTVLLDVANEYKYVKLDAHGAQVRIAEIELSFIVSDNI